MAEVMIMATRCPPLPMKIEVHFERREDGGLRAYSHQLPGFAISHRDPDVVMEDVKVVLEVMLGEALDCPVAVLPMIDVADAIEHRAAFSPVPGDHLSYVGTPLAA